MLLMEIFAALVEKSRCASITVQFYYNVPNCYISISWCMNRSPLNFLEDSKKYFSLIYVCGCVSLCADPGCAASGMAGEHQASSGYQ